MTLSILSACQQENRSRASCRLHERAPAMCIYIYTSSAKRAGCTGFSFVYLHGPNRLHEAMTSPRCRTGQHEYNGQREVISRWPCYVDAGMPLVIMMGLTGLTCSAKTIKLLSS